MPTYTFRNKDTGEEWSQYLFINEMEEFLAANKNIDLVPAAPFIGDPMRQGLHKPDGEFRDRIKEIKKAHPLNTIQDW